MAGSTYAMLKLILLQPRSLPTLRLADACMQGGKCAVFTLQRLGFEVDPVHSVQFSNHTGDDFPSTLPTHLACPLYHWCLKGEAVWDLAALGSLECPSSPIISPPLPAGYPSFKGNVFQGQDLEALVTGLEENNLTNYSHLLTG